MICRDVKERKNGTPDSTYRVWLPGETEQARAEDLAGQFFDAYKEAAEEAAAPPEPVKTIEYRGRRLRKPSKSDEPRLFDRATGTYGPMPQLAPAEIRASGPIAMNIAFREVTAFVTSELKAAGEQWTDQAKQDIVSTVLISAAKKGWLKVWER
jgi:hypothetical protein